MNQINTINFAFNMLGVFAVVMAIFLYFQADMYKQHHKSKKGKS